MHVSSYGASNHSLYDDVTEPACDKTEFLQTHTQVINCYYETWVLGSLFCELYGMTGSLFGSVSIWTMTMIAFDRYNVIVKGLSAKPMNINGALLRILGIWLFSLGWTIAPMFGWNRSDNPPKFTIYILFSIHINSRDVTHLVFIATYPRAT